MENISDSGMLNQADVLDRAQNLSEYILQSSLVEQYLDTREKMYQDPSAKEAIAFFNGLKEKYEEVQRFGKYHPDFKQVTRQVREAKKQLENIPTVSAFKKAEEELDEVLYLVGRIVANAVSEKIKVLSNNPLAAMGSGCGSGGCGSGGCSCQA